MWVSNTTTSRIFVSQILQKIWPIWSWKEVIKSHCGYTTARKKVFIQMCWASPFLKFVQELTDNIESFERETAKDSRAGYAV